MQDRPTASELLDAVAELLEETLMPATDGGVRHQARVAANLCRIVQRELTLGEDQEEREIALLTELLGAAGNRGVEELNRELCSQLLAGDAELERRAWPALVTIVRGKLAIAKPAYDDYDYDGETEA